MVVVLRVLVALLLAVVRRLADELDAGVGIERGHALLGEVEVVGAVVEALLGFGIRPQRPALLGGGVAQVVVQVEAPSPTTVMSFVRPHWLMPSMLMLASVFSSG